MVEYGAQNAAHHLSNAAYMLTVEKIEQASVLIETPSLQNPVKPYRGQYKTTVGPKQSPSRELGWLLRFVSGS